MNDFPPSKGIAVDAAYSNKTKRLQWQILDIETNTILYHNELYSETLWLINIGELLALIRGVHYVFKNDLDLIVYSDSLTALNWFNGRYCGTKVNNPKLLKLVEAGLQYLKFIDTYGKIPVVKQWKSDIYGENLADFGNKPKKKVNAESK